MLSECKALACKPIALLVGNALPSKGCKMGPESDVEKY